jgi:hypothetical protein
MFGPEMIFGSEAWCTVHVVAQGHKLSEMLTVDWRMTGEQALTIVF